MPRHLLPIRLLSRLTCVTSLTVAAVASADVEPEVYLRSVEADGGVALEVAIRTFERDDSPIVRLVGAVHIGHTEYYHGLQSFIEDHDLVLYEGVGGAGVIQDPDTNPQRVQASKSRVQRLSIAAARWHAEHDEWPSMDDLLTYGTLAEQYRNARSLTDAFGEPIKMSNVEVRDKNGDIVRWIEFTSFGADGEPGGEGFDADHTHTTRDVSDDEIGPDIGIQPRMARALGLSFQLDEMVFDRPHFINSDMSVAELLQSLEDRGEDAEAAGDMLLNAMGGQGMMAGIAGAMLGMIERSPGAAVVARAILADMLSHADDLLLAMPNGMGDMMEVLLLERNDVIVDDLNEALETQPDLETIAIIYGAGHLVPLEEILVEDFGYEPTGTEWRTAITAKPQQAGMDPRFFASLRGMMKSSLDAQIQAARRLQEAGND